jgi:hypothetical protein
MAVMFVALAAPSPGRFGQNHHSTLPFVRTIKVNSNIAKPDRGICFTCLGATRPAQPREPRRCQSHRP